MKTRRARLAAALLTTAVALTGCGSSGSGAGEVPEGWGTLKTKGVDVSYPKGYEEQSAAERGKHNAAAAVRREGGKKVSVVTVQLGFTQANSAEQAAIVWPAPPRGPGSARWSAADVVLIDEARDLVNRTPSLAHVVVDEAQDLSPMECRALGRRCSTGSATVLGDLAQGTTPWAAPSWPSLLANLGNPGADWVKLECLGDTKTLLPDPVGTLKATEQLVKEGFTADSAKAAVLGQNMSLLQHSGLISVQLQPPGAAVGSASGGEVGNQGA